MSMILSKLSLDLSVLTWGWLGFTQVFTACRQSVMFAALHVLFPQYVASLLLRLTSHLF